MWQHWLTALVGLEALLSKAAVAISLPGPPRTDLLHRPSLPDDAQVPHGYSSHPSSPLTLAFWVLGLPPLQDSFGCMAAAPYGSSLILPISYAYISMMGSQALTNVSSKPE